MPAQLGSGNWDALVLILPEKDGNRKAEGGMSELQTGGGEEKHLRRQRRKTPHGPMLPSPTLRVAPFL